MESSKHKAAYSLDLSDIQGKQNLSCLFQKYVTFICFQYVSGVVIFGAVMDLYWPFLQLVSYCWVASTKQKLIRYGFFSSAFPACLQFLKILSLRSKTGYI